MAKMEQSGEGGGEEGLARVWEWEVVACSLVEATSCALKMGELALQRARVAEQLSLARGEEHLDKTPRMSPASANAANHALRKGWKESEARDDLALYAIKIAGWVKAQGARHAMVQWSRLELPKRGERIYASEAARVRAQARWEAQDIESAVGEVRGSERSAAKGL